MEKRYTYAVGRRKAATAQIQLHDGTGQVIVNGRPLAEMLPRAADQTAVLEPFAVTSTTGRYNVIAKVTGGGTTGWAGALVLGISRALAEQSEENRLVLRRGPFLTRDARIKERKKYGLKRARKAPQYTKR